MPISEGQLEERKMRQERILAGALTVFKRQGSREGKSNHGQRSQTPSGFR